MRKIDLIVVHCSATREDRYFTEYDSDAYRRRWGFNGLGYHFCIRKDGRIVSARPIGRVGAHTYGFNAHSTGIYYEGGLDREGHPEDTRTPEQKHSVRMLVRMSLTDYPGCEVCGHRGLNMGPNGNEEIEPEEWIKACPCLEVSLQEVFG